jgi:Holliday junction resolvase RusA-like endonuclease
MKITFTIPGRLPGMNDFIGAMNNNRWKGADLKRKETRRCAMAVVGLPPIRKPVKLSIEWIERDARRDLDNIAAGGTKVLLDGLVSAGILPDDGRKWVRGISHSFPEPDGRNPRVEVTIEEVA